MGRDVLNQVPRQGAEKKPTDARGFSARRILCATDLTPRSDGAVQRAASLARYLNAEVMFVHGVADFHAGRVLRMKVTRAQAQLLSRAEQAMHHSPQDAKVSVRVGSAIETIAAVAEEWQPDLIVMARPQPHALDLFVGTTAERVIRATRCPVLIVGRRSVGDVRNVVLATDLSGASVHVARMAASMGVLQGAYTWVVHAFRPPNVGLLAAGVEEQLASHRRYWRGVLSRELLQQLAEEGIELSRVNVVVEPARPFDAIEQCLERARPELLIIGASRWIMLKRILFGSVADQVLRRVECDVLAVSSVPRARGASNARVRTRPTVSTTSGAVAGVRPRHARPEPAASSRRARKRKRSAASEESSPLHV